jgi:hypothetical protein
MGLGGKRPGAGRKSGEAWKSKKINYRELDKARDRGSVTYRRVLDAPMLEAVDLMRHDPNRDETEFLLEAWKAAYAKAKALGWL